MTLRHSYLMRELFPYSVLCFTAHLFADKCAFFCLKFVKYTYRCFKKLLYL
jgi:hypothetical protein